MWKALLIGLLVTGSVAGAHATDMRLNVQGVFPSGATLGGWFVLDPGLALPAGIHGSTLSISGWGAYTNFVGAAASGTALDLQFTGQAAAQGILNLKVTATYDLAKGFVYGIPDGGFGVSALYGVGDRDMFLGSGSVTAASVPEPEPAGILVFGLLLLAARGRIGAGGAARDSDLGRNGWFGPAQASGAVAAPAAR